MSGGPLRAAATPPRDRASAVLHLTSAAGGGVDRYIRDVAAHSARPQLIWHVGSQVDIIEHPRGRFLPLSRPGDDASGAALARWLREAGAGLVHLHGVSAECRSRLALLERALGLPYIVTLHDVMFVNPGAFEAPGMPAPDPAWIAGLADTLQRAAAVVAPSEFIRDVAIRCVPGLQPAIIAPGVQPIAHRAAYAVAADFAALAPKRIVAVVGAIGPHKGSGILDALAAALTGSDIGIVVIGYTDTQLARGWVRRGRYFVHGPYVDGSLAGWLAAYGADVVLFPNRIPESFSYTLSEVWAAGLPVIVPDEGALGDRVARHGGGWRLAAGYGASEAARLLSRVLSTAAAGEYAGVKSQVSPLDPARVPPLDAMVQDLDALYARYALAPPDTAAAEPAPPAALAPLLAANLDGFVFRQELVRLAEELANANGALANSTLWAAKLENDIAEAKAWAAKLECDIADTQTSTARLEGELVASQDWACKLEFDVADMQASTARLDQQLVESQDWAAKLERDIADMRAAMVTLDRQLADSRIWAAKLEGDVTEALAAAARLELQRADAQDWAAKLEGDVADTLASTARLEAQLIDSRNWATKLERDVADMQAATARLERHLAESQNWAAKLERDVADAQATAHGLQHELEESNARSAALERNVARLQGVVSESQASTARLEGEVAELEGTVAGLEKGLGASQAWVAKLEADVSTLNAELTRRVEETRRLADDKAAFDLLPELLRKFLLKKVFRARR